MVVATGRRRVVFCLDDDDNVDDCDDVDVLVVVGVLVTEGSTDAVANVACGTDATDDAPDDIIVVLADVAVAFDDAGDEDVIPFAEDVPIAVAVAVAAAIAGDICECKLLLCAEELLLLM